MIVSFKGRNVPMSRMKRNLVVAAAIALAVAANVAVAQRSAAQPMPSAAALLRFYPTRLASTPIGAMEDQEVWLAKVQGLMAGAPPLLQQSLLMSQTAREFAANVALLQQMQERAVQQSVLRMQSQIQNEGVTRKIPGASSNPGHTQQQ
jgi:hypothetical protein